LVPPSLFANTTFSAANAATLLVYGALGVVFVLLVLQLQVVAGFTPLAAGTALLPVAVIMLVFSTRAGALAGRIGPRLPMTLGPLVSAAGLLLLLRVDTTASWLVDVLPGVTVVGAGLTLTVAPLTSTVLDTAPNRFAGAASGVNSAGPRGWAARRGGGARARRYQRGGLHRPRRLRGGLPHSDDDLRRAAGRGRGGGIRAAAPPGPRASPPSACASRSTRTVA
jgi:hypothetical protein